MNRIQKLTKDGMVIIPATTTEAVIDPNTKECLADLIQYVLPVKTSFSVDNDVIEVGSETTINYSWKTEFAGKDVTDQCSYSLDGVQVEEGTISETITPDEAGEIVKDLMITYNGKDYHSELVVKAIEPSYYGVIDADDEVNAETIQELSGTMLIATKETTIQDVNLNAQMFVFAYPVSLGELESVKDANGFECYGFDGCSFVMETITINGVPYYVYYMKDQCSVSGFKFIFS